jgi:hypothetical protein
MKRGNDTKEKVFTTLDVYISGFLVLKGFKPLLIPQENGKKIVFVFPYSEDLNKEITNYNNGEKVAANRFTLTIKTLKSHIFSLRRRKK